MAPNPLFYVTILATLCIKGLTIFYRLRLKSTHRHKRSNYIGSICCGLAVDFFLQQCRNPQQIEPMEFEQNESYASGSPCFIMHFNFGFKNNPDSMCHINFANNSDKYGPLSVLYRAHRLPAAHRCGLLIQYCLT